MHGLHTANEIDFEFLYLKKNILVKTLAMIKIFVKPIQTFQLKTNLMISTILTLINNHRF